MAGAIAALAVRAGAGIAGGEYEVDPVAISGWNAVATSYPGFLEDLAEVAVLP